MKLRLLAPIVCAAAVGIACGGKDDDDNNTGTGGQASGTGGETTDGSGGNTASGGDNPGDGDGDGDGDGTGGNGEGGGDGDGDGDGDGEGGEGGGGAGSTLTLTSPDFSAGQALPDDFTCEDKQFGDGISPELEWSGAPAGTQKYALVFADTTMLDAGLPRFGYHWVAWNIPSDVTGLPKEFTGDEFPEAWEDGDNDGQQFRAGPPVKPDHDAFFGPCPSWQVACENGTQRSNDNYAFILYTFDEEIDAPEFDDENFETFAHQMAELFAEEATASVRLTATSDAAPAEPSEAPACPAFSITSPDVDYGDPLPDENTCEGEEFGDGISPALEWTGAPESTTHYALVFADTTLVGAGLPQLGYHWAAWNIPVSVEGIEAALSGEEQPPALGGGYQFRAGPEHGDEAFFGPCPSWQVACGIGAERSNDTYQFILYAYDGELDVPEPDATNYPNYVHQLAEFFASQTPLGKTALEVSSDAAPGVEPTQPACPELTFSIAGFTEGGEIPDANTCEGKATDAGVSPAFSWVDPLSSSRESYAIVMRSETLDWTLWSAWNIPSTVSSVAADVGEGATPAQLGGGSQLSRAPNNNPIQYYTPCPGRQVACDENPAVDPSDYSVTLYTFNEEISPPTAGNIEALATYLESNASSSSTVNVTSDAVPECDD